MKKKVHMIFAALLTAMTLTACGEDPALTQSKKSMDDF